MTVREYANPGHAPLVIDEHADLTDDVVRHATDTPDRVMLRRQVDGGWHDVTAAQFRDEVTSAAKGLVARGVGPGDRVGLYSCTRYEWTVLDYAIWFAGAVTVPIYESSSPEQARWILSDAACTYALIESVDNGKVVDGLRGGLPSLRGTSVLDAGGLGDLISAGVEVTDETIAERRAGLRASSVATIIYTSGTTGRPKGCMLTHRNFIGELTGALAYLPEIFAPGSSTLLFLPLAHVLARILQIGAVMSGMVLGHSPSVAAVASDMASFRPTFLLGAPRVFEKVFNAASNTASESGRSAIFTRAVDTAVAYSEATGPSSRPGPLLRVRHALFDRLVYGKFRAALGGRARYAISGGAPLSARTAHFYRGVGVEIIEGWGLTETTAAATANPVGRTKVGTVGKPLPWTSVRVDDDGELLVKGVQIFLGYLGNDEATRAEFTGDGWFRTGDLGSIDDDGYVTITGRKKEILVTAGGKNVSPSGLEEIVGNHPLVGSAMVVGDGRPFIAALVTLDPDAVGFWREQRGKTGGVDVLAKDPDLRAEVSAAVDAANATVSRAESIRKFEILPNVWSVESGELTPSFKLKRRVVLESCASVIDQLYVDDRPRRAG